MTVIRNTRVVGVERGWKRGLRKRQRSSVMVSSADVVAFADVRVTSRVILVRVGVERARQTDRCFVISDQPWTVRQRNLVEPSFGKRTLQTRVAGANNVRLVAVATRELLPQVGQ